MTQQNYTPLPKEELAKIKPGDVIERMLAFCIPVYLTVEKVENDIIDAGWTFDVNSGLEVDEDIPVPCSYIRRVLTEDQKEYLRQGNKTVPYK